MEELFDNGDDLILNQPTPTELSVISAFGPVLQDIVKNVLEVWASKMIIRFHQIPFIRPFREHERKDNIQLIVDVLEQCYRSQYEAHFGLMEPLREHEDNLQLGKLHIQSTGRGVEIFLGEILASRLRVIEEEQWVLRARIGFVQTLQEELPEDLSCPICQEILYTECPGLTQERPIKLIICCGNIFGESCLKIWLNEMKNNEYNETCPMCRYRVCTSCHSVRGGQRGVVGMLCNPDLILSYQSTF